MQQHTGVPPIIMQHMQPAFMQAIMQSQQPWIMSQQALSPLVQVITQPSLVISHLHMPIVMLQQHTIMPFIIMHMLHMPPAIIVQRFCIMVQAVGSSHMQVIFMPPVHFSIIILHRGIIIMFGAMPLIGIPIPVPMPMPIPPLPVAEVIGFIIAFTMSVSVEGTCAKARARLDVTAVQGRS